MIIISANQMLRRNERKLNFGFSMTVWATETTQWKMCLIYDTQRAPKNIILFV